RIAMHPGDLIVTPSWTYHDHGNPSAEPVVWLDGLDIPTVNFFDTSFAERGLDAAPPGHPRAAASISYPYREARAALDRLRRSGAPHASHGFKIQYLDPTTGRSPLPTLGSFLQFLPAGFRGADHRATDATVYCCIEGEGVSRVGDGVFSWNPRDV